MTYTKLTDKHQALALMTWDVWNNLKLSEKRSKMSGLVPNVSAMNTEQLTAQFRDLKKSQGLPDDTLEADTVIGRATKVYKALLPIVRKSEGLALALEATRVLTGLQAEVFSELQAGSLPIARLSRVKYDVFQVIDESLEEWDRDEQGLSLTLASDRFEVVKDVLRALVAPYEALRNLKAIQSRDSRISNRKVITSLSKLLTIAEKVLADPESADWRDLSVTLALATGRRMVEIHSSGGFVPSGEYQMTFTGVAKKRDEAVAMTIPTVFPADKVARVWDCLYKSGKHFESLEATAVNLKVAKPLSRHLDSLAVDNTYHMLRDIYAALAVLTIMPKDSGKAEGLQFMQSILGHESISATLSYDTIELPSNALELCQTYKVFGVS